MARSRQAATYAKPPYGLIDADFCALMAEMISTWGIRADVRKSAEIVALYALTRCWPATNYPRRERDKWSHKATAAFRTSERELAELTGFSQKRVHSALKALFTAGFIIELAPSSHRGEGRGSTPATVAFKCHLATQSMSYKAERTKATDQPQPAQAWDY